MEAGPLPVTIVRATQFHEFPAQLLTRLRKGPIAANAEHARQPVAGVGGRPNSWSPSPCRRPVPTS